MESLYSGEPLCGKLTLKSIITQSLHLPFATSRTQGTKFVEQTHSQPRTWKTWFSAIQRYFSYQTKVLKEPDFISRSSPSKCRTSNFPPICILQLAVRLLRWYWGSHHQLRAAQASMRPLSYILTSSAIGFSRQVLPTQNKLASTPGPSLVNTRVPGLHHRVLLSFGSLDSYSPSQ